MHAMMLSLLVAAEAPPDLSWLAGYWLSCDGGREVSETWSDARAGEMLGNSITLGSGKLFWEQARIGRSGDGWAFFARPMGQGRRRSSTCDRKTAKRCSRTWRTIIRSASSTAATATP